MATYNPTSELEAVNKMLTSISLSPISSLTVTGNATAALAISTLHDTSREVQAEGWHFNSESEYELTPDVSNNILIATNVLSLDPSYSYKDYVYREGKLYDKTDHTFTITEKVKCDIIWFLPWTDLPEPARNFIMIKAARTFQTKVMGSGEHFQFTEQDENRARVTMESEEARNADHNMFRGSHSTLSIITRDVFIGDI
jgi:hypothetical protein